MSNQQTTPPSLANEGNSEDPTPPPEAPTLSTPQVPDPNPVEPVDALELEHSATHIVVEHTRDGTVKTHVYAAKGNQPADLHESVLGRSALPRGDPTWSSHGMRTEKDVGEDADATTEAIDLIAAVTMAITHSATDTISAVTEAITVNSSSTLAAFTDAITLNASETRTALTSTLSGASSDICKAIDMSVQETTQVFRATHADALAQGGARGAQLVADNASLEMDRQIREQITPRLNEIAQYVASTAAAVERAERAMTTHAREGSSSSGGGGGGGSARGGGDIHNSSGTHRSPSVRSHGGTGGGGVHDSPPAHSSPMVLSRAGSVHGSEAPLHRSSKVLSRAGSVHGAEEAIMAMEDVQRSTSVGEAATSVSSSSVLPTMGDGHPEIFDKLTGLETKIETIYRVVVEGELPDSVPQLGDAGSGHAASMPTPEEVEAVARMEAMRREMVSFPDQLQQVSEKMEELRLALEKNVPVPNNNNEEEEEVATPVMPDVPDQEVVARNRALEEEEVAKSRALQGEEARWKESIKGSHVKHHELIEQLGEKIDGSTRTSKLAMKTFWVFMRLLLQHAKDMGFKMDQLARDFEGRTIHDQESHANLSGMLSSIQISLQSLSRQLPASLADNASEIQRAIDLSVATIQSSCASVVAPEPEKEEVAEEVAVPEAQDVVEHAGPSAAHSRSLPIPGPDISPAPTDKDSVVEEAVASDDASATDAVEQVSASSPARDSDPQLVFPGLDQLLDTIQSLQQNIAAMMAQHADLFASLRRSDAPPKGDTPAPELVPEVSEPVQETTTEGRDPGIYDAQDASSSHPPPPPGKPAEGYGSVPRSIARSISAPISIVREPLVLEEMGAPAEEADGEHPPTEETTSASSIPLAPVVTAQDLERMSNTLGNLAGIIATSAADIKHGQKFLHNELQAEILKVLHAIHPPRELETPEQLEEREQQETQARSMAEEASQRKADEYARAMEHVLMIPNLTSGLQSVNDHLAGKINNLAVDVAATAAQHRDQVLEVHQAVAKLLTGSIEDSGTLDVVRTLVEGFEAQHADSSNYLAGQLAGLVRTSEMHGLVDELKAAHESALAQHQEAILQQLEAYCRSQEEHRAVVGTWHKKHDDRGETVDAWQKGQDDRYLGFDQWRLLYNGQCADQDKWRQRVDDRHAEHEVWQKKSLELLERIEQAPRCRCCGPDGHSGTVTPVEGELCDVENKSVDSAHSNGQDGEVTDDRDRALAENRLLSEISFAAGSFGSDMTTCPSTPNCQKHAHELYRQLRSFLNEVASEYENCGSRACSVAAQEAPGLESDNNNNEQEANHDTLWEGSKHGNEGEESADLQLDSTDPFSPNAPAPTATEKDYGRELYALLLPYFPPKEQKPASDGLIDSAEGTHASAGHAECPLDEANEAKEDAVKRLTDLKEQYDAAMAELEALKTQNETTVSTIMDKNKNSNVLMGDKAQLEEMPAQRDEASEQQREKTREAERKYETLYQDGLGRGDLPPFSDDSTPTTLSHCCQLMHEAAAQLRQSVDEAKDQHLMLRTEVSALEDQRTALLQEVAQLRATTQALSQPLAPHVAPPPSVSSRRTGVHARGERGSESDNGSIHMEDKDEDDAEAAKECVLVEEKFKCRSGRKNPESILGSSRQASAGTSGESFEAGSTKGSRRFTRHSKRAVYNHKLLQGPKRRTKERVHAISQAPQLEADSKIFNDVLLSEALPVRLQEATEPSLVPSSQIVPTEEQLENVRMTNWSANGEGKEREKVEEGVWPQDMLRLLSLMACSPLLEHIHFTSISQNYHRNTLPLELSFSHHEEATVAKLMIGHGDRPHIAKADSQGSTTPSITILEWNLDHVHESMQDSGAQVFDIISRQFPSAFTSFTLDITALTVQGLVSIQNVLQRSTLGHLHVKCVPFFCSLESNIGRVLQAVPWFTIKSLVLTGSGIDLWLKLWASEGDLHGLVGTCDDISSPGPCLSSLSITATEQNKAVLSHTSALAIHHLVHSCPLLELRLKNLELKKQDWELVLGGINSSTLKKLSLRGSNAPGAKKYKVVLNREFQKLKGR
ncbi:hypothetical protein CPB97_008986, partial [Podila verticillata]